MAFPPPVTTRTRRGPERWRVDTCSVCFDKISPAETGYIRFTPVNGLVEDHYIGTHWGTKICVWCWGGHIVALDVLIKNLPQKWRERIVDKMKPGAILHINGTADEIYEADRDCEAAWAATAMFMALTRTSKG